MTTQLSYFKAPPTQTDLVLREAARMEPVGQRLNDLGPSALSVVELLQVVLDAKDALLPMRLLGRWSTLAELAHVSPRDLLLVEGMTPNRLARLRAALELAVRKTKPTERVRVTSPQQVAEWLMPQMAGLTQEEFWVVLLNTRNQIVSTHQVYRGNVNSTILRGAEVFAEAVRANTPSIIVAHNHPSNACDPSPEDVSVSRELIQAGKVLGIELLDHLIIGVDRFKSLKEMGLAFTS